MPNIDKAHSVRDGVVINEDTGGPFITGGVVSPVGLGMPAQTCYVQTDPTGIFIWKKVGAGDTASDWRKYSGIDVDFDDTSGTYKSTSINVKNALLELHEKTVLTPAFTNISPSATLFLTIGDMTLQVFKGSASGYSVEMPPANLIPLGSKYELVNDSADAIVVKDNDSTILFTLNPDDIAVMTLQENGGTAGTWIQTILSATATGIVSELVTTSTLFSTPNTADTIITAFTITPLSGRYAVWFSADIDISQNNRLAECVVYVDGASVENTRRTAQGVSSNFNTSFQTVGEVLVDGTEAVDVRVNITSGTLSITGRSLVLIRLGSV